MNPRTKSLIDAAANKARSIISTAEAAGRDLTAAERAAIESELSKIRTAKAEAEVSDLTRGGEGADLLAQFKAAGFVPNQSPGLIPFWAKTGVFDGDNDRLDPVRRGGVPLGFDLRHIWQLVPIEPVDFTTTSVEIVRQTSRSLPTSDSMIRDIDSDATKPEATTTAALFSLPMQQVAVVETSVPNVLVFNAQFSSFIQNDLRLSHARGLDWLVADTIVDAGPTTTSEATLAEGVIAAAEVLLAAGYNPTTVVVNPTVWRTHVLARATDPYLNRSASDPLDGFRFVISNSYYGSDALVLDPSAVGRLYQSSVSLRTFEENAGATNSSTVRLESHAGFAVERLTAVEQVTVTG